MKTVGVLTLGCKVNTYESEYIISKLKENNYIIKDFTDICDIYIINTCTVTNTADIKSKKMIKTAIKRNPDACVVAMGCFIEANKDYEIEGLDIVIGNKDKSKIIELLDEYFIKKETLQRLYKEEKTVFEDMYINDNVVRFQLENSSGYQLPGLIEIDMSKGYATIGRYDKAGRGQSDFNFDASMSFISKTHLRLEKLNDSIQVIDMNSGNGTYVNGTKIVPNIPYTISKGDFICFSSKVTYKIL